MNHHRNSLLYNFRVSLMNPYNIYGYCYNFTPDSFLLRKMIICQNDSNQKINLNDDEEFGLCTDDLGMYILFRDSKWKQITNIKPDNSEWDIYTEDKFIYQKFEQQFYIIFMKLNQIKKNQNHAILVEILIQLYLQLELYIGLNYYKMNFYYLLLKIGELACNVPDEQKINEQQNAGNVFSIEGVQFVIVRNAAGHMVLTDHRKEAYYMTIYFILD